MIQRKLPLYLWDALFVVPQIRGFHFNQCPGSTCGERLGLLRRGKSQPQDSFRVFPSAATCPALFKVPLVQAQSFGPGKSRSSVEWQGPKTVRVVLQLRGSPFPSLDFLVDILGGCWDTFCIFACCGLVGNPHLAAKIIFFCSPCNINQALMLLPISDCSQRLLRRAQRRAVIGMEEQQM